MLTWRPCAVCGERGIVGTDHAAMGQAIQRAKVVFIPLHCLAGKCNSCSGPLAGPRTPPDGEVAQVHLRVPRLEFAVTCLSGISK